jgi:hypothetical protein
MIPPLLGSRKKAYRVVISVARPVSPRYILSLTGKIYVCTLSDVMGSAGGIRLTFSKFKATVIAPAPRRKSLAIATQSLPAIAMTDPPLWSIIDCG